MWSKDLIARSRRTAVEALQASKLHLAKMQKAPQLKDSRLVRMGQSQRTAKGGGKLRGAEHVP